MDGLSLIVNGRASERLYQYEVSSQSLPKTLSILGEGVTCPVGRGPGSFSGRYKLEPLFIVVTLCTVENIDKRFFVNM